MRSRRFIPSLANPYARLLVLEPVVARHDKPGICEAEPRVLREVARGLYDSHTPAMQRAFRKRFASSRAMGMSALKRLRSGLLTGPQSVRRLPCRTASNLKPVLTCLFQRAGRYSRAADCDYGILACSLSLSVPASAFRVARIGSHDPPCSFASFEIASKLTQVIPR